ncbi:MAG: hypothetical protein Q9195_004751 [Heterodermia aff. obscurata]
MVLDNSDSAERANCEPVKSGSSHALLDEQETTETPPKHNPHLVYKVHYRNTLSGQIVYTRESESLTAIESKITKDIPALELITDVATNATLEGIEQLKDPPHTVLNVGIAVLKINSPAIINALQKVVEYYPTLDFSGESLWVPEPFNVLIHHESELASFRDKYAPGQIQSESECCERERDTYEHLGVLQNFLKQRVGLSVETERLRHKRGFATFDMLWMLLKPGITVYYDHFGDGNISAYVVHTVTGGMTEGRILPLEFNLWYLHFDGSRIGKTFQKAFQHPFNGERRISALAVIPCEFWEEKSTDTAVKGLAQSLEEGGKMFLKLTSRRCMNYDGMTTSIPKIRVKGLVMADSQTCFSIEKPALIPVLGQVSDGLPKGVGQCLCPICLKVKRSVDTRRSSKFSDYEDMPVEKTRELTSHQYILCSRSVWAYFMKARGWRLLNVACFSDPSFDRRMIDTLVMPDERRQMIKALAENHAQGQGCNLASAYRPWTADFVEGKGEGKIFLLHGKPGVGKTYTAECIAEFTKRPLMSLTTTDIGTNPAEAEQNLNYYFERARLWDAIILIDEADVYMERREVQDLTRNSLVSGFLRAMENCQSILFLTTNRVGAFDDAFISRIHISLYYPDLSEDDRRKIWRNFFGKLIEDRGDIMRIPIDTKDYTNGKEVRALKLNGREIRNTFQTAVALADYEGAKDEEGKILLKDTHIMQIVRMSKEFKTYLQELHQGDESKRAERQRIRFDEYDGHSEDSDR